jgi:uncharacterized protein YecE (DUF72 family)
VTKARPLRPPESPAVSLRASAGAAQVRVGCAGWSLSKASIGEFPEQGSHLQRYAAVFDAVEINSSFYRPHRAQTYARWAASVPARFRFSVKLPKTITHERRLLGVGNLLDAFLDEVAALGSRLGCLLVQLPPSLAFDARRASAFFAALRRRHSGSVAVEPRHASWFDARAEQLLQRHAIARVAADPARVAEASEPGGDRAIAYFRLHGSPRVYYSNYEDARLRDHASILRDVAATHAEVWCIFDNTALGAANADALSLQRMLRGVP